MTVSPICNWNSSESLDVAKICPKYLQGSRCNVDWIHILGSWQIPPKFFKFPSWQSNWWLKQIISQTSDQRKDIRSRDLFWKSMTCLIPDHFHQIKRKSSFGDWLGSQHVPQKFVIAVQELAHGSSQSFSCSSVNSDYVRQPAPSCCWLMHMERNWAQKPQNQMVWYQF